MLLAGPSADSVVEDTTGDDWEADRVALETRELSMTDFLVRRGLVLRTDLLGAWSGWLTPVFEPRRYRTWFFVAMLPGRPDTRDVSTESSSVTWMQRPRGGRSGRGGGDHDDAADLPDLPGRRPARRPPTACPPGASGRSRRDLHPRGDRRPRTTSSSRRHRPTRRCWTPGDTRWSGRHLRGDSATCVLAPNADIMTLDGTNTWVLAPRASVPLVIDPGPSIASHLDAVRGRPGRRRRAADPPPRRPLRGRARPSPSGTAAAYAPSIRRYRLGSEGLVDGDVVTVGDLEVHVVATPGHTADSLSFVVPSRVSGAHGRHRARSRVRPSSPTPTVARCLPLLAGPAARAVLLAGDHVGLAGPRTRSSTTRSAALDHYIAHRRTRLDQVRDALRDPARDRARGRRLPARRRCRGRSSRSSTPTSTRCCGALPSCRCARSWPTSRPPPDSPHRLTPVRASRVPGVAATAPQE